MSVESIENLACTIRLMRVDEEDLEKAIVDLTKNASNLRAKLAEAHEQAVVMRRAVHDESNAAIALRLRLRTELDLGPEPVTDDVLVEAVRALRQERDAAREQLKKAPSRKIANQSLDDIGRLSKVLHGAARALVRSGEESVPHHKIVAAIERLAVERDQLRHAVQGAADLRLALASMETANKFAAELIDKQRAEIDRLSPAMTAKQG